MIRGVLFMFDSYIRFFFFKQKTAYEMRITDWNSDVFSSDLLVSADLPQACRRAQQRRPYSCRRTMVRPRRLPPVARAGAGLQGDPQPLSRLSDLAWHRLQI